MKAIKVKNAKELAKALGLSPSDAIEMEIRSELNEKIIKAVEHLELTHTQLAKLIGMSRTRLTAILNRNTHEVSTDLMIRILGTLGYRAKITFLKVA